MTPDTFPRVRVSCVILHQDGRVLLQHRDEIPDIVWPGYWGLFGGHIEPGETPSDCARREMQEELGLSLPDEPQLYVHRVDGDVERNIFIAPLSCGLDELQLNEGQDMRLFSPAELLELHVVPIHRELILGWLAATTGAGKPDPQP